MKWLRRIIRFVLVTVLLVIVVVPSVTYVVLSTSWAQDRIRAVAQSELSSLLGTEVEIGRIDYKPFNTLAVSSVAVKDDAGRTALGIGRISARFELWDFLRTNRLLFDYAVVDAPEINIVRADPDSPLNISGILERLSSKDKNKTPTAFDLKIGTIILRDGRLAYDVESEESTPGRFNPNHVRITELDVHAFLRHVTGDEIDALLESLSFREQSGFVLSDFTADVKIADAVTVDKFELRLPHSEISLKPFVIEGVGGLKGLRKMFDNAVINIASARALEVSSSDLSCFSPFLAEIDQTLSAQFELNVSAGSVSLDKFSATTSDGLHLDLTADFSRLGRPNRPRITSHIISLGGRGSSLANIFRKVNEKASQYLSRIGMFDLSGDISASESRINAKLASAVDGGEINVDAQADLIDRFNDFTFSSGLTVENLPLGSLLAEKNLGTAALKAEAEGRFHGHLVSAEGDVDVMSVVWNAHNYKDIKLSAAYSHENITLDLNSDDPGADFDLSSQITMRGREKRLAAVLDIARFVPEQLNLSFGRKGLSLSGKVETELAGNDLLDASGYIDIDNLKLHDDVGGDLVLKNFRASMTHGEPGDDVFSIESDWLNGTVEGEINPRGLAPLFRYISSHVVPALFDKDEDFSLKLRENSMHNRFAADFTLSDVENLCRFLKLPVTVIYPVEIMASANSDRGSAGFSIDIPYLQQGDKIIDATAAGAYINTEDGRATAYASTHMPTKKGPMTVVVGINGADSRFDTRVDWEIERDIPLNGIIDLSTLLSRSSEGSVCIENRFNPGQINFGDDVWNIHPSEIEWCDGRLRVDNFRLTAGDQEIAIEGRGSKSADDVISVSLKDIAMLSIFETLEIENAMIGGCANGTFHASSLLSGMPIVTTDNLHVDSISYNRCVIGTADVTANWDNEKQSVYLDAVIMNPEGQPSYIKGDIFPMGESLDLTFDATHVRVGFMQTFMAAFASEVKGYGSGHAHLFGTFHDIDMEGDIFADDLSLKIDFTNTVYHATDSVHIEPGIIKLENITIRDVNGNTALVNGVLTHEYFHLPRFDFQITEARNFLCYDISEAMNPDWYGTIYGNGSASVTGSPGVVDIGANMSTAPGSVFTFVLSDRLDAEQYSFITFNDVTELTAEEKLAASDVPEAVREYRERMMAAKNDKPSDYNLDFRVDITPDAQIILVMDPVGGDRIRSYGSGDMRLTYNSTENDIRMYGTYTLDRGNYNFTLQDIIIKDFTIDAGSSITFRGDPYSAQLNIEAAYQLNANLTDLDESFALDKDLNRTNVPVQALLKVSGDMRQPDLDFDLRFPTLTSDTYRKVRSIISTDDMMNRQIIYLLALNRFYTPDYMESTTKGNELFSVASSTIASQLSSMLGKLSDKWSIAPNLRSDRGDFSDVEVDVALSSRLLNNRLLLNGNLGYRDKSLNTNQFIGDFDIEYLLTPKGNWRLKGYSRYNDQNYYVRTAPTTQGVGIMFRRDFDSLFKPKKNKTQPEADAQEEPDAAETDASAEQSEKPIAPAE